MINASNNTTNQAEIKAQLPDITQYFTEVITCILMTPKKGDPRDVPFLTGKKLSEDTSDRPPCLLGLPSIIWGLSGIGKSERIEGIAQGLSIPFAEVYPSMHPPEDFSGMQIPDGQGNIRTVCSLPDIEALRIAEQGVVFLDEASGATPATQAAMLEFVNRGRIGDIKLPPGIRRILAANPPEFAASGWALESPMANRLAHFQLQPPSNDEYAQHLLYEELEERINLAVCGRRLVENWGEAWSHVSSMGASFLRTRSNTTLHKQPLPSAPQSGYAWPSPRSWTNGLRAAATAQALELPEVVGELMLEGCVGWAAGSEFANWRRAADLPRPEVVLEKGWTINTDRLDITMAVVDAVAGYVSGLRDIELRIAMATRAYRFFRQTADAGLPDITVCPTRLLLRAGLTRENKHATADYRKALESVLEVLQKQNLMHYAAMT